VKPQVIGGAAWKGGDFSQPPDGIEQMLPWLVLSNADSVAHTFTLQLRIAGSQGFPTIQLILPPTLISLPTALFGMVSIDGAGTASSVGWFYSPEQIVGPSAAAGSSPIVFPSGASILDNGAGGIEFLTATGKQVLITAGAQGGLVVGAGNNWQMAYSGNPTVGSAISLGGVGYPSILGNSPTPLAVNPGGATPAWSPLGASLTKGDATHPLGSAPPSTFTLVDNGTYKLAEFRAQGFTGLLWVIARAYINITAIGAHTAQLQVVTLDDGGNPLTFTLDMDRANGVGGATMAAADIFTSTSGLLPYTADQTAPASTSAQTVKVQLVVGGAAGATFSATTATGVDRYG
jgi:hypothetical protein